MKIPYLALALCSAAGSAQAAVLAQTDNGFQLENRVEVRADAAQAYQALVEHVGHWWPADHSWFGASENFSIQARPGGCLCEIAGADQVEHMRVVVARPGHLLRMVGGLGPLQSMGLSGPLDWIFEPLDQNKPEAGTRIRLRYTVSGFVPKPLGDFVNIVDQVQAQQLGALADFINNH